MLELLDLLFLFFCVVRVAGRRTDRLVRLLLGENFRLHLAEFINGGESAPLLLLAGVATPCCGALCTVVLSSTSRPACQWGGPSSVPRRRPTSHHLQVVSSPAMAPMAVASSCASSSVEKDQIAFPNVLLRSFL